MQRMFLKSILVHILAYRPKFAEPQRSRGERDEIEYHGFPHHSSAGNCLKYFNVSFPFLLLGPGIVIRIKSKLICLQVTMGSTCFSPNLRVNQDLHEMSANVGVWKIP